MVVEGTRTPFLRSGTDYKDLMAYQLAQIAILHLLHKTSLATSEVQQVILGTVVHNIKTSNVARESALSAGLPFSIPCYTVSQACISANKAIANAADQIALGYADVIIAGGTECVSDTPVGFSHDMRKKLFAAQKMKSPKEYLQFALSLRPKDLLPEVPLIAEFTTQRTMGQDCDRMADRFDIERVEQDQYAVRSHQLAALATDEGWIKPEIAPAEIPPSFMPITVDNGVRGDTTLAKISKLPPAFTRPDGTLTAANSSFLTDGAAVVLLMSEQKALSLGYTPKAYIKSYSFTAQNPENELLLGPAFATPRVLDQTKLTLADIGVLEFHEAFAAQVLANIKCLESDSFCRDILGRTGKVGEINMDALNIWGGSLAIGHPFGATGARLVTTAANRLLREDATFALIASCAAGAQGHAMILERYDA